MLVLVRLSGQDRVSEATDALQLRHQQGRRLCELMRALWSLITYDSIIRLIGDVSLMPYSTIS